jgi:hypothetical protein
VFSGCIPLVESLLAILRIRLASAWTAGSALGDGWLASAYNTTLERFREGLDRLAEELRRAGKAPERFPSAIATAWLHVTEDTATAERLAAFVAAGTPRIFVWPLGDEVRQLELFRERVTSLRGG